MAPLAFYIGKDKDSDYRPNVLYRISYDNQESISP